MDFGGFRGSAGTIAVGVDFVEETEEEEIVIALPEEVGIVCFDVGVAGAVDFDGLDLTVILESTCCVECACCGG